MLANQIDSTGCAGEYRPTEPRRPEIAPQALSELPFKDLGERGLQRKITRRRCTHTRRRVGREGVCAECGVSGERLIQVVTFSKALGSQGGAVVGPRPIIDLLANRARSFIFETALSPPSIAAARAALESIRTDHEPRKRLDRNVAVLQRGLERLGLEPNDPPTPVFPLILGSNDRALTVAREFKERGYFLLAIRPPTVEPGTARLRVTTMADHEPSELERFIEDAGHILS